MGKVCIGCLMHEENPEGGKGSCVFLKVVRAIGLQFNVLQHSDLLLLKDGNVVIENALLYHF